MDHVHCDLFHPNANQGRFLSLPAICKQETIRTCTGSGCITGETDTWTRAWLCGSMAAISLVWIKVSGAWKYSPVLPIDSTPLTASSSCTREALSLGRQLRMTCGGGVDRGSTAPTEPREKGSTENKAELTWHMLFYMLTKLVERSSAQRETLSAWTGLKDVVPGYSGRCRCSWQPDRLFLSTFMKVSFFLSSSALAAVSRIPELQVHGI